MRLWVLAFLVVAFAIGACTERQSDSAPLAVDLCKLASSQSELNNTVVRFQATVESNLEHTVLFDPNCSSEGFEVIWDENSIDQLEPLLTILYGPQPDTLTKEVRGVFVGRFRLRQRQPRKVIELIEARDLAVRPRSSK